MTDQLENVMEACDCEPYPPDVQEMGCVGCAPKMYLTSDEEAVLAKMRDLKDQVRPISNRLREIERKGGGPTNSESNEFEEEWSELSGQLESLRNQWREWETRLDEAIERKLILLGHREAPF
jgi:predicted nuclease with TOPRIM domain